MPRNSITVRFENRDWPQSPRIGVLAYDHRGRIVLVADGPMREPHSVAGVGRAFSAIVRAFLEPELGADADEHLERTFAALIDHD